MELKPPTFGGQHNIEFSSAVQYLIAFEKIVKNFEMQIHPHAHVVIYMRTHLQLFWFNKHIETFELFFTNCPIGTKIFRRICSFLDA